MKIVPFFFAVAILFFTFQMSQIVAQYLSWEWDVDFLLTKVEIIHLDYYRGAFYAHIFSSLAVLGCGAFMFSKKIQRDFSSLHRWSGRVYVGLLLLVSAPAGMVMAFHANGGWAAKISFLLLTPTWWWFTWQGYRTARRHLFQAHRRWMLRSYALTLSAVSLRLYQMLLGPLYLLDPETQYVLVSWASWVGNLALAELYLARRLFYQLKIRHL